MAQTETMPASFFEPGDGDGRFVATVLTRGPWDRGHQHVGPPSALLARAIETFDPRPNMMVGRMTVEILRPVPIGVMDVRVEVLRPGNKVQLVTAVCEVDGRETMRATAWRLLTADVAYDPPPAPAGPSSAPPGPDTAHPEKFFPVGWDIGYHTGMEALFVHGGFRDAGPAMAWLRMKAPLLPDETPSPLVRVMCAADSGNGISSPVDYRRYLFVNTDLTVHLHRYPRGDWVGMDSRTIVEPHGVGLTESSLFDTALGIGSARQCLFVRHRETDMS